MAKGRVVRIQSHGRTVTMYHGLGPAYQEPEFCARVYDAKGHYVAMVSNSTLLALKGGSVRAIHATDAQILEAVLNDESVFDY